MKIIDRLIRWCERKEDEGKEVKAERARLTKIALLENQRFEELANSNRAKRAAGAGSPEWPRIDALYRKRDLELQKEINSLRSPEEKNPYLDLVTK